jgi:adenylosuccinate lyase
MTALIKKGMNRQETHELLRKLSAKSQSEDIGFREVLLEDPIITGKLDRNELEDALNPRNYLGTAVKQVEIMIEKTKKGL